MAHPVPEPAQLLHRATLATLQTTGFVSTSSACAGLLTDALERYLHTLAARSVDRAEINGRNGTSVNALDVQHAIDRFGLGGIDELRDWADDMLMGERDVCVLRGPGVEAIGELAHDGRMAPDQDQEILLHYLPVPETVSSPRSASGSDRSRRSSKRRRSVDSDEGYESGGSDRPVHDESWLEDWMPPLPGAAVPSTSQLDEPAATADALELASLPNPPVPDATAATTAATDSFSRSQLDSYLQPIAYSASMLKESHPHAQLTLHRASDAQLPERTSSFPALLRAYQETAQDPSMTLSVKPLRHAAAWYLIQGASNPDTYNPPDTLYASPSAAPPGPRASPIVPVHPIPDAAGNVPSYPLKMLPLDPHPPTLRDIVAHPPPLLSTLVRDLAGQSPFLPRPLRDRLTSLRPPNPLNGVYYGQQVEPAGVPLRATWDAGRGDYRDGRLPSGRKVVCEKLGHEGPSGGAGKLTFKLGPPSPAETPAERAPPSDKKAGGLKLKLFARP